MLNSTAFRAVFYVNNFLCFSVTFMLNNDGFIHI